ncbi:hypothetical protein MACJ_002498 [Theileria orientalis]|uniref:Uncharacterized protein n=1 Tax=Theileria orientalis TaxID=68886 RepID=A0A976M696_THEOR|nr:hypothetical protein MACJ_002498 [Theileria orientalis]
MTKTRQIDINTNQEVHYKTSGRLINVTQDKHWDPLSKVFKKYTHTINYTPDERDSQYNIIVVAKGSVGRTIVFQYKNPSQRVEKVEVYFKGDHDIKTNEPLIVRFVYQGGDYFLYGFEDDCKSSISSKCYYAWSKLKNQETTSTIDGVESISEKDLVTVLLEEIGSTIDRRNKVVIRLGEQPADHDVREVLQYPDSGFYSERGGNRKITVSKVVGRYNVPGYEGYEHTISSSVTSVSDFYVSYLNNSRFFKIGSELRGQHLHKVTAYFKNGSKNLVLITFTFRGKSELYVYSYFDFVKELKEVKSATEATNTATAKIISGVDLISDDDGVLGSGLKKRLEQEKEKLRPLISFVKGTGLNDTGGNKNVITGLEQDVGQDTLSQGYKFKKFNFTPITGDDIPEGDGNFVPGGQWIVYSTKLFNNNDSETITNEDVLTPVITSSSNGNKYSMITVYYSTKSNDNSDRKALLVEFVPGPGLGISSLGSGTKLYIKRKNKDNTWANESASNIGTSVNDRVLTDIATQAKIIVSPSNSDSSRGEARTSDQGVHTDNTARDAGIATGVIGVGAVGTGIAIYKNFAAVMGLIGKIF